MHSDSLYKLIKALSRSEKGYFKKFVSLHSTGGENNYVLLFDSIAEMNQYDEKVLAKKLQRTSFVNRLSSEKVYLFNLILKSLRNYYSIETVDVRMRNFLRNTEILIQKGLYNEALKLIKKTKKAAIVYDRFNTLLEAISLEKRVLTMSNKNSLKIMGIINKEERLILKKYRNLVDYRFLNDNFFSLIHSLDIIRTESEKQKLDKIMGNPLMLSEPSALSQSALRYFHTIKSMYYYVLGDIKKCFTHQQQLVRLFDFDWDKKPELVSVYISVISNYLLSAKLTNEYAEYSRWLEVFRNKYLQFKTSKSKSNSLPELFIFYYNHELDYCIINGDFDKPIENIKQIKNALAEYEQRLPTYPVTALYYNIAFCFFGKNQYSDALFWLNKIVQQPLKVLEQHLKLYTLAGLLDLLIHFELGNFDVLRSKLISIYRLLLKNDKLYGAEKLIFDFMKTHVNKMDRSVGRRKQFSFLRKEMTTVFNDPREKIASAEYAYLIPWLDSKISNTDFQQEVKRRKIKN